MDQALTNLTVSNSVTASFITAQSVVTNTPIVVETIVDDDADFVSLATAGLHVTEGAQVGYVLTCTDVDGQAEWRPGAPDGDVDGPVTSVVGALSAFNDGTGKVLRNTLISTSNSDTTLNFGVAIAEPIQVAGTPILKSDNNGAFLGASAGPDAGGDFGVAIGDFSNTAAFSGESNVAVGFSAMSTSITEFVTGVGSEVCTADSPVLGTFVGRSAGLSCSGTNCIGIGILTLTNTAGAQNVAIGNNTLSDVTANSGNVAVGHDTASDLSNYNTGLCIGAGITGALDSGTFLINPVQMGGQSVVGSAAVQMGANITGLPFCVLLGQGVNAGFERSIVIGNGATGLGADNAITFDANPGSAQSWFMPSLGVVTNPPGTTMEITAGGQIGPIVSSKRFKEDWQDLDFPSEAIDALQAVTFRLKSNGKEDFGLLAEDVLEVPVIGKYLVTFDTEGRPASIRYHMLNIVLLLELKRLRQRVADLEQAPHMVEVV